MSLSPRRPLSFYFSPRSVSSSHNYLQDSDFVLICSNGGQSFYTGNHAENISGLYTSPRFSTANLKYEEENYRKEAERHLGIILCPSEVSNYWVRQGWQEIMADPRLSLKRFWRKVRWALGDRELTDTRTFNFYGDRLPVLRLPLWGFGGISLLGILGALWVFRDRKYVMFWGFLLFYCSGISLFFVYGRYRLPLLAPMSILAAAGLARAYEMFMQHRFTAFAAPFLIGLPVAWLVFSDVLPGSKESFFPDYYNQGNHYLRRGMVEKATLEYEKALWVRPGDHPAVLMLINRLSDLYVSLDQPGKAETLLRKALKKYPQNEELRQKLQQVARSMQNPEFHPRR